jgi:transposase-like protein
LSRAVSLFAIFLDTDFGQVSQHVQQQTSGSGRRGKGRWSAERKMAVVLEFLRGEDLESLSRKYAVTAATLSDWRDAFLTSGEAGLKIREDDLVDERGRRMKSVIAELAMTVELQRERIQQLENANPSLKWRSKR